MRHSVEAVTQTVLVVGSNALFVDSLHKEFTELGWFALSESNPMRALTLLDNLTVSAICLFDDGNDLLSSTRLFKQKSEGMLFILSDNSCPERLDDLYQNGLEHMFAKSTRALEVKTVVTTLQQQQLNHTTLAPSKPEQPGHAWHFCFQTRELSNEHCVISQLSHNESKVLKMLIDNSHETLPRERLMMALGRFNPNPADRTLDRLVCNLRKKFKKICPETEFIVSLYGHGYVFAGSVSTQVT